VIPALLLLAAQDGVAPGGPGSDGCLSCHSGIEEIHPWQRISCVECHGGDGAATTKEGAHVRPGKEIPNDESVVPLDHDLPFRRFRNPSDLRVLDRTCGICHAADCSALSKSLHGTTAGHLSDGLYENGVVRDRRSRFALFPAADEDGVVPKSGFRRIPGLPRFDPSADPRRVSSHFADVPRKSCAQCHLYSEGRAVRGRLGMDGDYRGHGCSACHVTYADDGLSRSADPTIDKFEPGHPRKHRMTAAVPTSTCVHCHYGDASIGLSFRGLAQLVPGQPSGPDVPGTTKARLNGVFYQSDPRVCPPDVHHEKGMACIDCHTVRDVMGDGNLYGAMEDAVEIECIDCHGTFEKRATLETSRGAELSHLRRKGDDIALISKVDGREHPVPQALDAITPGSPRFNPRAAAAMTPEHGRLECYACHASWVPNFFGFHFDRNESFTQLDLLSGERTPGRVTTQEKVFATFRPLYLGWNPEGLLAPYMVGFSTTGSAYDKEGKPRFVQQMPVTSAGLSGMTLVHHQTHTVRKEARGCVECHRSPQTLGLGSPNFRLARDLVFATSARGFEVVALDRKNPAASRALATLPLPDAGKISLDLDPLQGRASRAFVGSSKGISVLDLGNPAFPRIAARIEASDPRDLLLAGGILYVADGASGVAAVDVAGKTPRPLGRVATSEARALALAWPWLFVADGPGGLAVLDVGDPARIREIGRCDTNGGATDPDDASDVALLFQSSRPDPEAKSRTPARHLAALACGAQGGRLLDVTDPEHPFVLAGGDGSFLPPRATSAKVTAVSLGSVYDLGSEGGDLPTEENDYAYLLAETMREGQPYGVLVTVRVTDPTRPEIRGIARTFRRSVADLALARIYNAPFLQHLALVAGDRGLGILDATKSAEVETLATIPMREARAVAVEEFPFDRLVDESGRPLKDISHEGARYLSKAEIEKVLRAPIPAENFAPQPAARLFPGLPFRR
jgi:LVIVD repeat-containing protein